MSILKSLVKIANELDAAGLDQEANALDSVIAKLAGTVPDSKLPPAVLAKHKELEKKYKIVGVGKHKVQSPRRMSLAREAAQMDASLDYAKRAGLMQQSGDKSSATLAGVGTVYIMMDGDTLYCFASKLK